MLKIRWWNLSATKKSKQNQLLYSLHEETVQHYHEKVMYTASIAIFLTALPFCIALFFKGMYVVGILILTLLLTLLPNAIAIHQSKKPPVDFRIIVTMVTLAFNVMFYLQPEEIYLTYWLFPCIVFTFFSIERISALIYSSAFIIISSTVIYLFIDVYFALRFFCTSALVIIMLNQFVKNTNNLHYGLISQANRDALTGVLNRNHMNVVLENAYHSFERHKTQYTIIILDIDHFKDINDEFGHTKGDEVLRSFAKLLQDNIRKSDTLFRVGGEEFMILYNNVRNSSAQDLANHLRHKIENAIFVPNYTVTASLGISELTEEMDVHAWYKTADDALYKAKNTGRNQVVIHANPATSN